MSTSGWFAAAKTAASENPSTKKITASGLASSTEPVTAVRDHLKDRLRLGYLWHHRGLYQ